MSELALGNGRTSAGHRISSRGIANFFIGLAVFLGGFVFIEPAPYELVLVAFLCVHLLFGLRIPKGILPMLVLFALFSLGGIVSSFQIEDYTRGLISTAITFFLGLTAVFFAILINQDMGRLRLIFRLYVAAAVVTSIPGILGYFGAPGFEMFTRYGRSQGAFEDPNVYAPFLVAPILYLMYGVMNRSPTMLPARLACLGVILLGVFLAFSRAGWGFTVLAVVMFYFLMLITRRDAATRLKYIMIGIFGMAAVVGALVIALQFDAISSVFSERAQVVQDYDGDRLGRFARHLIGFDLALTNPLGIGPLEFGFLYGADTHNIYLKSLLAYGWLGFISWMVMIFWTLGVGFKLLFRQRPWLPYYQIAYVVFFGHLLVAWVIDIDHWRHFYLMLGVIWGCIMLEKNWQRGSPPMPSTSPST